MSESALLEVYRRPDLLFTRGDGARLVTDDGRDFLDFTSGIGVNALGFGSETIRAACLRALSTGLVHTSNLFRTEPAEELAALLVERAFPGRAFFCNSGAEAVEGAFKFARRWAGENGGADKREIVALEGAFHGRLFGSLAATDRPGYREPFEPLMPGVRFVPVDDSSALEATVRRERTAAVIVEPVQGEGGVRPVPAGALREIRDLCDETDTALILDEVQCGLGRTGTLFAFERAGVTPDLLALAKPLAGGLPMGAVIVGERVAASIRPGDHATTFGGGPLVASVASAVVRTISDPSFLAGVRNRGETVERRLAELRDERSSVQAVRGMGLMWGVEISGPAADVVSEARAEGLLLAPAGERVVRLLPPLNVAEDELDEGLEILTRVVA